MTLRQEPPFRADHVGSLLRPQKLAGARRAWKSGDMADDAFRAIETEAIRNAVAGQRDAGLVSITDGEFQRDWWHLDFLAGFDGIEMWQTDLGGGFNNEEQPPLVRVTDKIRWPDGGVFVNAFKALKAAVDDLAPAATAKITIPGPGMMQLRAGRKAIDPSAYTDMDAFWSDLSAAYRQEIAALADAGCRYLQIDDVSFAYLCDDAQRASFRDRGENPDEVLLRYRDATNDALRQRPDGLTITTHMCRGNFKSSWVAEGGYGRIAETLFPHLNVDGFFLEYDTDRAGGFEPLTHVPDDKLVVLGLVTSKTGDLEAADAIRRRVDEAAAHIALDNLCLSPQCGFSSTHHGNDLTVDQQWSKLGLVVDTAEAIWGRA